MRRFSLIGSLVFTAFGLAAMVAGPASAALCARWDPPDPAAVGNSSSVSFRTYIPVSTDCGSTYKLEAHPFPDYPFRVRAVSPTGTVVTVAVAPSDEDTSQWLGQFTPDQTGSWTLHIVNLADADAACYSDMPLAVTTQTSTGSLA